MEFEQQKLTMMNTMVQNGVNGVPGGGMTNNQTPPGTPPQVQPQIGQYAG
jgi:hypothetical protein